MDGLVDFEELIKGLDVAERGSFPEKCKYCYQVYDAFALETLDIYTLRWLLKKSFSEVIVGLEKVSARMSVAY